ncbi:MAG: serine hydrolase [Bryobacterales bacterium]|nr:serine hydrolase [Bryobacterales bacterium]
MRSLPLLLLAAACAHAQLTPQPFTPQQTAALDARIRARIAGFPGHVSLHARNLATGAEYGLNPDERVRTASTIKLPILCALHDLAAQGKVKWDEELTLTEADRVSGSGVLQEFTAGARIRVRDAANLMIVVSDNTATNLILGRITADAVNAYMAKLGLHATKSLRKVRGDGSQLKAPSGFAREGLLPEYRRFGLGVSSPRDMVRLLEMIHDGKVVSPKPRSRFSPSSAASSTKTPSAATCPLNGSTPSPAPSTPSAPTSASSKAPAASSPSPSPSTACPAPTMAPRTSVRNSSPTSPSSSTTPSPPPHSASVTHFQVQLRSIST